MNCENCPLPNTSGTTLASTCPGVSFLLFMSILEFFIRKQCDLEDPCGRISSRDYPESSYDFIVIGSGSAGSVVSSRLSENKDFSVLLLEAGLDEVSWTQVPSFFRNIINTNLDWQHIGVTEKNSCLNLKDKKCILHGGKVLGGSSSINGMMYMRGSRKDYDDWEKLGNEGWSFRDVLPFFKKSENNLQIDEMDAGYHSKGGPLTVTQLNYMPPISSDLLKAAEELGYATVDLNGKNHTGFCISQTTSNKGSRLSASRAFIRPAKNRQNLHVILNATATKVVFNEEKKAVAVEFYKNGKLYTVGVHKEVIVSAGAINSPQILLNSGIGPRKELEDVGVSVVHDLPGVGKNLHDHVAFFLSFTINEKYVNSLNWATALDYLLYRKGALSGTGTSTVTGMINTKYANTQEYQPDIQLVCGGYSAECSNSGAVNNDTLLKRKLILTPFLLHPKSQGYVRLKNNNPLSRTLVSCNYFSHPDDIAILIEGIKFAIQFTQTEALKKYDFQLDKIPVKNCENIEFGSDSYWTCAIKHNTVTGSHFVGSCKMGPDTDPLAVVDQELRVKGVQALRIADTSIMPKVTSGNTNAPAIMIGERAADFIKKCWSSKNHCYNRN